MEEGRGMEELEKICICLGIGTTLRAVASQVEGPSVLKLETNPNNPPITVMSKFRTLHSGYP
jgi:hypothetical protein